MDKIEVDKHGNPLYYEDEESCNFKTLRKANLLRDPEWGTDYVSPSFRGVELAGETGEACNEVKKLERTRLGMVGGKTDTKGLEDELADVVICADLIDMDFGIDLGAAVRNKFNKTSDKHGFKTRIS